VILVDSNIPMYLVGAPHPHKADAQRLLEKLITDRSVWLPMPRSCRKSCTDVSQSFAAIQSSQLSTLCSV